MEVKTNKEYHAKQAEITGAESEVQELEDRLLEQLLDGDELAAAVKDAEQAVATERTVAAEERTAADRHDQVLAALVKIGDGISVWSLR